MASRDSFAIADLGARVTGGSQLIGICCKYQPDGRLSLLRSAACDPDRNTGER